LWHAFNRTICSLSPWPLPNPENIHHPTLNTQHPMTGRTGAIGCSMLDVGCWMLLPVGSGVQSAKSLLRGILSPRQRGYTSAVCDYSPTHEPLPALRMALPAPEPGGDRDGPLSLSLSPSEGERVPKAGEGAVQRCKARSPSGGSLPKGEGRGEGEGRLRMNTYWLVAQDSCRIRLPGASSAAPLDRK
jgi:hypothetical protein